ncbi:MAG: hypothetical protein M3Q49_07285 [Actinomycetota bacterium]|nr:hypothetical protein [Actinomycetota bacterium]
MSLTSHLKDPTSPVYRFVRENFPNTRVVVRAANARLQGAQTIRPEGAVHWSTVGTAADYRIRYYLGPAHEAGAARHGARMLEGRMMRAGQLEGLKESEVRAAFEALAAESEGFRDSVPGFFAGLEEILARLRPWQKPRRLGSDDEALLCRHCAVLALFEQVFRVGRVSPGSPLIEPEPARGYDELLARVPDLWVEDLCVLSWSFFDSQEGLMRGAERVALAPTFEGSFDVGGADADSVLDGMLADVKATTSPKIAAEMIHQLLGYVLLDYSDRYGIREVAVYLARQASLVRWPLGGLLAELGAPSALPDLREAFAATVRPLDECCKDIRPTAP